MNGGRRAERQRPVEFRSYQPCLHVVSMKNCRFVTAAVTEAEENFVAGKWANSINSDHRCNGGTCEERQKRVEISLPRRRLLESHQDPAISGTKLNFDLPVLSIATISSTSSLGKYLSGTGRVVRRLEALRAEVASADGVADLMRK